VLGMKLTINLWLVLGLRISGAIAPLCHIPSWHTQKGKPSPFVSFGGNS